VTKHLHRYYNTHDLHFITGSCYQRQPELDSAPRRDLFLTILEEARCKYRFVVHGYVVMPEHFHLLITEPEVGDPSVVMKVIKERFSRQLNRKRRQAAADKREGAPLIAPFCDEWDSAPRTGEDLAETLLRFQCVD
jgi:REP element-mobilizing transposase RayT